MSRISEEKDQTLNFLRSFHKALQAELPAANEMEVSVRRLTSEAKTSHAMRHLRLPESAFLNTYVVPRLFSHLQHSLGLSPDEAREALLNEYYPSMPDHSTHSPASTYRHPFGKALSSKSRQIYDRWKSGTGGSPQIQSCPDFALRQPCPHKVVFEGKYFSKKGSREYAERELVTNLYQAFFYRGLPKADPKGARAGWDYDFACLLAYDSSPDGTLKAAWRELPNSVREGFWKGGNVYVMILGGQGRSK